MALWDDLLTEEDRAVIAASGHGGKHGFGDRPCLMLVDMQRNFVGVDGPILESVKLYPTSTGSRGQRAVEVAARLLAAFRAQRLPVMFTLSRVLPAEAAFDAFQKKLQGAGAARNAKLQDEDFQIVPEIAPAADEIVLHKRFASGFMGTPLMSFLNGGRVDGIVAAGITTSGCVRATVVDAAAYNFRIAVVADACADRLQVSHKASLLDMHMRYADVVQSDAVLQYLGAAS